MIWFKFLHLYLSPPHQLMLGDLARFLATWLGSTLHWNERERCHLFSSCESDKVFQPLFPWLFEKNLKIYHLKLFFLFFFFFFSILTLKNVTFFYRKVSWIYVREHFLCFRNISYGIFGLITQYVKMCYFRCTVFYAIPNFAFWLTNPHQHFDNNKKYKNQTWRDLNTEQQHARLLRYRLHLCYDTECNI